MTEQFAYNLLIITPQKNTLENTTPSEAALRSPFKHNIVFYRNAKPHAAERQ